MGIFKRTVILILALALAVSVSFSAALPTSAADTRYGQVVLSSMSNQFSLRYAYDKIAEGCAEAKTEINLQHPTYKITAAQLNTVYDIFMSDYPEYFWVEASYSFSHDGTYVYTVKPDYSLSGAALNSAKAELEAQVSLLTQDLGGKSDYEKALLLHDRLAQRVSYASSDNDQNAYGALKEGRAVCAGYARAYQLLLSRVGVRAWYITGTSKNPTTGRTEGHAWNSVLIDGSWCYTDVTWDDQGDDLFYAYFNCPKSEFEKDHTFDAEYAEYLPSANTWEKSYFFKNGLFYSRFDAERIGKSLKENGLSTRIYVLGDADAFYASLRDNLLEVAINAGLPSGYSCSSSARSLGGEIILKLTFVDPNHTHSPTLVPAVAATCFSGGKMQYYECSCGKSFSDKQATAEITDAESLRVPAKAHTASSWTATANEHFKACTACGTQLSGTLQAHTDSNTDYSCDTCGYALPQPEKTPPIISGEPSASTPAIGTENNSSASDNIENNSPEDNAGKGGSNTALLITAAGVALAAGAAAVIYLISRKNNKEM